MAYALHLLGERRSPLLRSLKECLTSIALSFHSIKNLSVEMRLFGLLLYAIFCIYKFLFRIYKV